MERGRENGSRAPPLLDVDVDVGPRGQAGNARNGCERVERPRRRIGGEIGWRDTARGVAVEDDERVERVEVLDPDWRCGFYDTHDLARPGHHAGDERPRNARAAELFEHHGAVGPRESVGAQREHAGVGQLRECRAVESGADPVAVETAREQCSDAVAECDLVVVEVEIHHVPNGARAAGRARVR